MKYYIKLALITLLVSVAAAEIVGPLVGMRGYIGPMVMSMFGADEDASNDLIQNSRDDSDLEVPRNDEASVSVANTAPSTSSELLNEGGALEACVGALKSVSLHPEFAQIPVVTGRLNAGIYSFNWPTAAPTRMMDSYGGEANVTASCDVGEDGRFRKLTLGDQELFRDEVGRTAVIGDWRIDRAVSKVDRSTNVTLSTRATSPVVINGEEVTPTLVLHCGENKTVSYVKLGANIGSGRIVVKSYIDGNESSSRWSISTDGMNIYQGNKYITLLRALNKSSQYSVSLTPSGMDPVEVEFSLNAIKAAINPLQEACHWR